MLANRYYIGTVRYAGVDYDGRHEPLIDRETFTRVGAVLAAHNHAAEKDRKHHHYLKGSVYCGRCGSRMSLIHAKGNGGTYRYFYCIGRMKRTGCTQPYVRVDRVEQAVERIYATVRLPSHQLAEIRNKLDRALDGMRTHAEQEATRQRRRLAQLNEQREKLLHAYYAGAIPTDLLRLEQDRLAGEIAHAEHHVTQAEQSFTDIHDTLAKALDLLADPQTAYRQAPGHLRRQWNQALFQRLIITDDQIADAQLAEPFATLTNPELPAQLAAVAGSPPTHTAALSGGGSNEAVIVGETGFEPATARPPAGCATRLRHSPWLLLCARAGDGNRTRPRSLEGSCATTTPRPQGLGHVTGAACLVGGRSWRHGAAAGAAGAGRDDPERRRAARRIWRQPCRTAVTLSPPSPTIQEQLS